MNKSEIRAAISTVGREEHVSSTRKTVYEEFEEALVAALVSPSEGKVRQAISRLKLLIRRQETTWETQKINEREREAILEGEAWLKSLSKKAKSAINCQLREPLK
jgi:hypothetical protein